MHTAVRHIARPSAQTLAGGHLNTGHLARRISTRRWCACLSSSAECWPIVKSRGMSCHDRVRRPWIGRGALAGRARGTHVQARAVDGAEHQRAVDQRLEPAPEAEQARPRDAASAGRDLRLVDHRQHLQGPTARRVGGCGGHSVRRARERSKGEAGRASAGEKRQSVRV
jgi:hypothetical protein